MTLERTHCRWCGRDIMWLDNDRTGKKGPIDWAPTPDGPIVMGEHPFTYHVLTRAEAAVETRHARFTNHWMTCEKANEVKRDLRSLRKAYKR